MSNNGDIGMRERKIDTAFYRKHGTVVWLCRMMAKLSKEWRFQIIPPLGINSYELSRPGTNNPEFRDIGVIGFTYWFALIPWATKLDPNTWYWFRAEVMFWTKKMVMNNPQAQIKIPLEDPYQEYPEMEDAFAFKLGKIYLLAIGEQTGTEKPDIIKFGFMDFHDTFAHEITIHLNPKDKKQGHVRIDRQLGMGPAPNNGWQYTEEHWANRLNVRNTLPPWIYVPERLLWLHNKHIEEGTPILKPTQEEMARLLNV